MGTAAWPRDSLPLFRIMKNQALVESIDRRRQVASGDENALTIAEGGLLDGYLACLAARLLLHFPNRSFLNELARPLAGEAISDPTALASNVADYSQSLSQQLAHPAHACEPLAIVNRYYGLSPFELDLLLFAISPELDESFGDLYASLAPMGNSRRLRVGQAIGFLVSDTLRRSVIREGLHTSVLWEAGLLQGDIRTALFERLLQASPAFSAGLNRHLPASVESGELPEMTVPTSDPFVQLVQRLYPRLAAFSREYAHWAANTANAIIHITSEHVESARLHAKTVAVALDRPLVHFRQGDGSFVAALREAEITAVMHG